MDGCLWIVPTTEIGITARERGRWKVQRTTSFSEMLFLSFSYRTTWFRAALLTRRVPPRCSGWLRAQRRQGKTPPSTPTVKTPSHIAHVLFFSLNFHFFKDKLISPQEKGQKILQFLFKLSSQKPKAFVPPDWHVGFPHPRKQHKITIHICKNIADRWESMRL